jgi:replicative DNA helicase
MQSVDKMIETQASLLGSIFPDPSILSDIATKVDASMFLTEPMRILWKCFLELNDDNVTVFDLITIRNRLGTKWELFGGGAYFERITNLEYSSNNADRYADSIVEYYRKSQIVSICDIVARVADSDDTADEMLISIESSLSVLSDSSNETGIQHAKDIVVSFEADNNEYLKTQFPALNEQLIGLGNSQLIIVMGSTSMGKSSLMLDFFRNIGYTNNIPAAYFSCEMTNRQNKERLSCTVAGISLKSVMNGYVNSDQKELLYEAARQLGTRPLYFDMTPSLTPVTLRRKLTRSVRVHGTKIAFVDHIHKMKSARKIEGRRQELASIAHDLSSLAIELNIPIVLGAQANRACATRDNKRPGLHDILECGEIEQQANTVMSVFRPSYYGEEGADEITVLKGRDSGTGTIFVEFQCEITSFRPLI